MLSNNILKRIELIFIVAEKCIRPVWKPLKMVKIKKGHFPLALENNKKIKKSKGKIIYERPEYIKEL